MEIPARRTGPENSTEWTRTRYVAAVREVQRRGVTERVHEVALAFLAQWAIECGWGDGEWNWNLGNIRVFLPRDEEKLYHWLNTRGGNHLPFRAYTSLEEGTAAQMGLATVSRYLGAWTYVQQTGDGPGFYKRLLEAGWGPWSAEVGAMYRSVYSLVVRRLGDPAALLQQAPGGSSPWGKALALVGLGVGVAFAWRGARR